MALELVVSSNDCTFHRNVWSKDTKQWPILALSLHSAFVDSFSVCIFVLLHIELQSFLATLPDTLTYLIISTVFHFFSLLFLLSYNNHYHKPKSLNEKPIGHRRLAAYFQFLKIALSSATAHRPTSSLHWLALQLQIASTSIVRNLTPLSK